MIEAANNPLSSLASRYNLGESVEWRVLLRHFDLAADGFNFIVLLVPDADGAAICRQALADYLAQSGKTILDIPLETPDDLKPLAGKLLDLKLPEGTGAVWVAASAHQSMSEEEKWKAAWREGVARLNQFRNPLRRSLNATLIFAGAPWLQVELRQMAPDLWSVRTLVVNILPLPVTDPGFQQLEPGDHGVSLDPEFAWREAEKLRGQPGKQLALAKMLYRAGDGFNKSSKFQQAVIALQESLEIFRQSRLRQEEAAALHLLGIAKLHLGDLGGAAESFESALAISRALGDRLSEAGALANLGNTHSQFGGGGLRKALEYHEQHLLIAREMNDRRGECAAMSNLGTAYFKLGEMRKALEFYQQCLFIARELGDRFSESATLGNLGNAYAALGEARRAIEYAEQALAISRELGDRRSEAIGMWNLALALDQLRERRRAVEYAEAALKIFEEIKSPAAAKVQERLAKWRR